MRRVLAAILLLFVALRGWAAAPNQPVPTAQPTPGHSAHVAGWWFQYLGEEAKGDHIWLFPHFDGIHELFRARQDGPWLGDLGTRFDPQKGTFENTFNGAEVLNEFLDKDAPLPKRQEAARIVKLWLAVHPAHQVPYYARDFVGDLDKCLSPEASAWVDEQFALRNRLLKRVGTFGVEAPGLQKSIPLDRGPQEYYRRMIHDGYLDIAIVSGNLRDNSKGTYHSWQYMEEFRRTLVEKLGFKGGRFRHTEDETLGVLQTRMLGQPVTVRVYMTGGSMREYRIVRAVANFVEGLAHADLFVYMGHSNYSSGSYYISEADTPWSRFQIGLRDQRDLSAKCHLLRTHPCQLLCFQSCSSYRKYAQPIRWYYARTWPDRPGHAGFMGTSEISWFMDFVPRYTKVIELLLKEQGARTIQDAVNEIRPMPATPPMILRGFLQSPASFILPDRVTVANIREEPEQRWLHLLGDGSDGRTYCSTEVFAQNVPGEIVQVAAANNGLYGLTKDGRIYFCGPGTLGAALESELTAKSDARFAFISTVRGMFGSRPLLIGTDGLLYRRDESGGTPVRMREQPPEGVTFAAAGEKVKRGLIAQDEQGGWWAWDYRTHRFSRTDELPDPPWEPSLLGRGTRGVLYSPGELPVVSAEK